MKTHPDFEKPWCKRLLKSDLEIVEVPNRDSIPAEHESVSNSMFLHTLYTDSAIRAQINFRRSTREPDAVVPYEYCYLLSIGDGVDGKKGRAHGGFNALILDQLTGSVASQVSESIAPATATMTVDYKAPIDTPGVLLCRGWAIERNGRKIWVKASIENGEGQVLAVGKALFISPRKDKI